MTQKKIVFDRDIVFSTRGCFNANIKAAQAYFSGPFKKGDKTVLLKSLRVPYINSCFVCFDEFKNSLVACKTKCENVLQYLTCKIKWDDQFPLYVAQEKCAGTLRRWVTDKTFRNQLNKLKPVEILRQIANGMEFVHSQRRGMIITPDCVYVQELNGELIVKISDSNRTWEDPLTKYKATGPMGQISYDALFMELVAAAKEKLEISDEGTFDYQQEGRTILQMVFYGLYKNIELFWDSY